MVKARGSENPPLQKGAWAPEEDKKLIAYVRRYGIWNWKEMPKYAGLLRCGKSCRLRWMNHLRPNVKRGNFTQDEDETIIKLHEELGNRWSAIASKLPGRTDNDIKNHWHTRLKKHLIRNQVPSTATKSSQETQTTNQQNPTELLLADPFLPNNAPIPSELDVFNESPTSSQLSADEIGKIQSLEVNNYGPFETFDQLHNFWEHPFTIEDLCMLDDYGPTYTYTDSGFMISTSLWGFQED